MFFVVLEAKPRSGSKAASLYGGAAAACWINVDSPELALARASELLRATDWREFKVLENRPVERSAYMPDDPNLGYFDQALTDGEVCVLYTYPRRKKPLKPRRAAGGA
jgi:hypothetical protein